MSQQKSIRNPRRSSSRKWQVTLALSFLLVASAVFAAARASLTFDETSMTGNGAVTINGAPASNVNIGTTAVTGTVSIGTSTTTGAITIGSATSESVSVTDNNWSVSAAGAGAFTSLSASNGLTVSGGTVTLPSGGVTLSSIADDADSTKVLTAGGASADPHWAAVNSTTTASGIFSAIGYGDGSDGAGTISTDTTLTKDMLYTNLTVNSGTLNTVGYRIYATGTVTIASGAKIAADGGNAAGGDYGQGVASAKCGASGTGTYGMAVGQPGTSVTGLGGAGGAGGSGSNLAGGAGGTATGATTLTNVSLYIPCIGILALSTGGKAGGGGGGSGGSNPGWASSGGGGAGGGTLVIVAGTAINNSGTLSAKGGVGGNAPNSDTGGGGGGGGGIIFLVSPSITAGTTDVSGGAGGTGNGSGTNGSAGIAGNVYSINPS